jgi:hypothetical protein
MVKRLCRGKSLAWLTMDSTFVEEFMKFLATLSLTSTLCVTAVNAAGVSG